MNNTNGYYGIFWVSCNIPRSIHLYHKKYPVISQGDSDYISTRDIPVFIFPVYNCIFARIIWDIYFDVRDTWYTYVYTKDISLIHLYTPGICRVDVCIHRLYHRYTFVYTRDISGIYLYTPVILRILFHWNSRYARYNLVYAVYTNIYTLYTNYSFELLTGYIGIYLYTHDISAILLNKRWDTREYLEDTLRF